MKLFRREAYLIESKRTKVHFPSFLLFTSTNQPSPIRRALTSNTLTFRHRSRFWSLTSPSTYLRINACRTDSLYFLRPESRCSPETAARCAAAFNVLHERSPRRSIELHHNAPALRTLCVEIVTTRSRIVEPSAPALERLTRGSPTLENSFYLISVAYRSSRVFGNTSKRVDANTISPLHETERE